jgi:hypothetical protein
MARLWNLAETAHICFDKGKNCATSSLLITLLIKKQLQIAEHMMPWALCLGCPPDEYHCCRLMM